MSGLFGWFSGRSERASNGLPVTDDASGRLALDARGLVKGFGQGETRSLAVQNVSMKLHRGEMTLLMGPSGSGKSTLLAMISGLLRPDDGTVHALRDDIWKFSTSRMENFRLKHCSYIFQGCNLFPALTGRQQLELVLRWGEGASATDARRRADAILNQLGLSKKGHLRPAALSGGEKQRVAIARALVKEPTFLFADEPTSALDWENGQAVIELLHKAAHERGAMVLVVTHDSRLIPYADRVMHMEDGKMVSVEATNPTAKSAEVVPHPTAPAAVAPRRVALNKLLQDVNV